jgi:hypothetical protein
MAYKVNYNFQKAERDRAKAAKKEAKLREKQSGRVGGGEDEAEAGAEPTDTEQLAAEDTAENHG